MGALFATSRTGKESRKDAFSSRLAFILSTAGSAIGLANIWKFPYIVGKFGGAAFIFLYLIFLVLVGIPAFLSEIIIGKTTQKEPTFAFEQLGKSSTWRRIGNATVWTGFLVSSFYSVVAGWILGYFFQALTGSLASISAISIAHDHYTSLMHHPFWTIGFHALFMLLCGWVLLGGIKNGIEFCNKLFMPIFFLLLLSFTGYALFLPSSTTVFGFMGSLDFGAIPRHGWVIALGHAFFTLSIGQGTLVTYGSYLKPGEKILSNSLYVILADTLVSLLAAFSILSIVFAAKMDIEFGPGLIFETLPTIFSKIAFGQLLATLFFFFIFIAALTSQVSALEPLISHLTVTKKWLGRKGAVVIVVASSFALGIPSALAMNLFRECALFGYNFLELMNFATTSVLIPLGGFAAVCLTGWRWGIKNTVRELDVRSPLLRLFFMVTVKYSAPIFILVVFLHSLGLL